MMHCVEERNSEDTRSKRQQILKAAYEVFSRKGYNRATVDEIIALADTGKGTVYNYFTNKEQLFYTLIEEQSRPFVAELEQVATSDQPVLVKIERMVKLFLKFYSKNSDIWRVLMHEIRGFEMGCSAITPATREKFYAGSLKIIGQLERVISDGISQGILRDNDVTKASYGLLGVILTLVYHNLVGEDVDEDAMRITDVYLYGVAQK